MNLIPSAPAEREASKLKISRLKLCRLARPDPGDHEEHNSVVRENPPFSPATKVFSKKIGFARILIAIFGAYFGQ
jgi:hypothetical protein